MTDIIKKITALIDRAIHAGTDETEARSSALIACKLIRQHKIILTSTESTGPQTRRTETTVEWDWSGGADLNDLMNELRKATAAGTDRARAEQRRVHREEEKSKREAADRFFKQQEKLRKEREERERLEQAEREREAMKVPWVRAKAHVGDNCSKCYASIPAGHDCAMGKMGGAWPKWSNNISPLTHMSEACMEFWLPYIPADW